MWFSSNRPRVLSVFLTDPWNKMIFLDMSKGPSQFIDKQDFTHSTQVIQWILINGPDLSMSSDQWLSFSCNLKLFELKLKRESDIVPHIWFLLWAHFFITSQGFLHRVKFKLWCCMKGCLSNFTVSLKLKSKSGSRLQCHAS